MFFLPSDQETRSTHRRMESMMKEIQPCELYVSGQTPVLTGRFWCMEEWSFAKSSLPGIGRDKSWKVSTVVETCHTELMRTEQLCQ